MSYNSLDDDLFEYDPDQDHASSASQQPKATSNNHTNSFIGSLKDNFDDSEGPVNTLQASFSSSFITSSAYFINGDSAISADDYAIKRILDELTNGRFSLYRLFKLLENRILRLKFFLSVSQSLFTKSKDINEIFFSDQNTDRNFQDVKFTEKVSQLFNSMTDLHVKLVYHTQIKIIRHSLNCAIALYQQLAVEIGETPLDHISTPYIPSLDEIYDNNSLYSGVNNYSDTVNPVIISDLSDKGLLSKISDLFESNVEFHKN